MVRRVIRFYVGVAVLSSLIFCLPSVVMSATAIEIAEAEHPSLMYQQRRSYALMLSGSIARHSPDSLGSINYKNAEKLLKTAQVAHDNGNTQAALQELGDAVLLLEILSTEKPLQAREQRRYLSLKEGLPFFISAHQRHYDEQQVSQDVENSRYRYDQDEVEALMSEAESYSQQGRFGEASILLQTAQEHIASAIKSLLDHKQVGVVAYEVVPSTKLGRSQDEIDREHYEQSVASIKYFKDAHARQKSDENYQVTGFDNDLVEWLLHEADALASEGRYAPAIEIVKHVRTLITKALRDTLNGQDIVVTLDVSTPELEFKYEYRRYLGYEELISVAIERMRPDKKTLKLVAYYADQGKEMAQQALAKSSKSEYPVAISMILDATRSIQMALRTAGVPIYDAR